MMARLVETAGAQDAPLVPDEALIEEMERIPVPAILYLPGGRIAAVNRAAARLSDQPVIGSTIGELLEHHRAVRADGSRILRGDLPYIRALRGEVVDQGERIEMTLPGGWIYRAMVTSTPVIVDGAVVAALSVWHDFDAYIRNLALSAPPGIERPANGP